MSSPRPPGAGPAAARRVLAALVAAVGLAAGCATPPPAASSGPRVEPGAREASVLLDDAEQARAVAALRSVAGNHVPVAPPRPAPAGTRWSDVSAAVRAACDELEMAVLRKETTDEGGLLFHLVSIDERPGRLEVRRAPGGGVGEASAVIGRFGDHVERADRLIAAFEAALARFGRKRGFAE